MSRTLAPGVWPTMVTLFDEDGKLDFKANAEYTDWLIKDGAHGLFTVCQSSEMFYLSLQEKVDLAKCVVEAAAGRVPVIASGHTSDQIDDQINVDPLDTGASIKVPSSIGLVKRKKWAIECETRVRTYIDVVKGYFSVDFTGRRICNPI